MCSVYDGLNGFAIGRGEPHTSEELHDLRDAEALLEVLREEVIPLYYGRDRDGLPRQWIARMKRAIRTLGWRFSAGRMVTDYVLKSYIPAGEARAATYVSRRSAARVELCWIWFFQEVAMPRAPKKAGKENGNGGNGHITSDEVAKKAYDLYLSRGGGHGADFDDWIEAEKQLKESQQQQPPPAPERGAWMLELDTL